MAEQHTTACILCSINCGLVVTTEDGRITRVKGDKAHPTSQGYLCEKSSRLDYYQNGRDRLDSPMRRCADGTYESIDWETAIDTVAQRLGAIRDTHGGESIFYYGGGGQGNHLCGAYGQSTRAALGVRFTSNALAQEKTGEFWVDGQLYGRTRCHTTPDFEHAEVAMFVGKNPWQSHGFPRARKVIRDIAKDPNRTLIVIDPRRSETAEKADIFLQVRPGADAWLLAALLAVLVREEALDSAWLDTHTADFEALQVELASVDVSSYAERSGVPEADIRRVARVLATAGSVSILEDLGIQQAPHSTLNSWLEKLLYLVTGNFAKRGGMNIHSNFAGLGGGKGAARSGGSPVLGHRLIAGLVPCNIIVDEVLTDHPNRYRAMIIESVNPVHSLADSQRWREAMEALEFSVVIDVAMSETARCADIVLPASSQYEKWEATFFNLEFPDNAFQLRRPVFEPRPGTLPEAEIHRRLCVALGALDGLPMGLLSQAAEQGLERFGMAFAMGFAQHPKMGKVASVVLYEALGPALREMFPELPHVEQSAVLWGAAQRCAMKNQDAMRRAGFEGKTSLHLGNALFRALLERPSGVVFTRDEYSATWERLCHGDKRIRLVVDELLEELRGLSEAMPPARPEGFPLVLSAGERRSSTANTIYRNPEWRKTDRSGALRVSPQDAVALGIEDGGQARIVTKQGSAVVAVEVTDMMQPGHISLPNGTGVDYPDAETPGVAPNELTNTDARDWLAGTPWHKHVPARVERLSA